MRTILFALIVIFFLCSFRASANEDSSVHCPTLIELNSTTKYYLKKSVARLLSDQQYMKELNSVGLETPLKPEDFRLLTTAEDSAVCQKLNEMFDDLDNTEVFDRETGEYVPSMFGVYYEIQNKYVVIWQPYNPGSDVAGQIGPPGTGWRFATVYDKANLTYIGRIGF